MPAAFGDFELTAKPAEQISFLLDIPNDAPDSRLQTRRYFAEKARECELLALQLPGLNSKVLENVSSFEDRANKPVERIAQNHITSDRIYKQEIPPAAERELHSMFPQLSHHNRLAHAKGTIYDHLQEAHQHARDLYLLNKFEYFRNMVNTNRPWDFKSFYVNPGAHDELKGHHVHPTKKAPLWVQNYGNFHYGAMAFALGLTEDQALILAGAAQQGGTEKHKVMSPAGLLAGVKNTAKAAILPNHGDSDANDQYRIKQGYEWAQKHATELGIND